MCDRSRIPTLVNESPCCSRSKKENNNTKINNICCSAMKSTTDSYKCFTEENKSGILKKNDTNEPKINGAGSSCCRLMKDSSLGSECCYSNKNICCGQMKNSPLKSDCYKPKGHLKPDNICCSQMRTYPSNSDCYYNKNTKVIMPEKNYKTNGTCCRQMLSSKDDKNNTKELCYKAEEPLIRSYYNKDIDLNKSGSLETIQGQPNFNKIDRKTKEDIQRIKEIDLNIQKLIDQIEERRRCSCVNKLTLSKSDTKRTIPLQLSFKKSGSEIEMSKTTRDNPQNIILPEVKVDIGPESVQTIQIDVKPSDICTESGVITIPVQLRFKKVETPVKYSEQLIFEACDTKNNEFYMEELRDVDTEKSLSKQNIQLLEDIFEPRDVPTELLDSHCPEIEPKSEDLYNSYIEPYLIEGYCASTDTIAIQTDLVLGKKLFSDSLNSLKSKTSKSVNALCSCGNKTSIHNNLNWDKIVLPDQIQFPEIPDLNERQPRKLFTYLEPGLIHKLSEDNLKDEIEPPAEVIKLSDDSKPELFEEINNRVEFEPDTNAELDKKANEKTKTEINEINNGGTSKEPNEEASEETNKGANEEPNETINKEKSEGTDEETNEEASEELNEGANEELNEEANKETSEGIEEKTNESAIEENEERKRSLDSSGESSKEIGTKKRSLRFSEDLIQENDPSEQATEEDNEKKIILGSSEDILPPAPQLGYKEPIPGGFKFVYTQIPNKNEPYTNTLWKEFPSDCDSESTLPWKKILLPEIITIRKIQKLKPVQQEGSSSSTPCICRSHYEIKTYSAPKLDASNICPFIKTAPVTCVCGKVDKSGKVTYNRDEKTITYKYVNKNLKDSESSQAAFKSVKKVSKLNLKIDPVVAAFQACEAELKPVREALNQVQRKLKNLNMPELDFMFKKTDIEIPPIRQFCKCKRQASKSRGTSTKLSGTKLKKTSKTISNIKRRINYADDEIPNVKKNVNRLRAAKMTKLNQDSKNAVSSFVLEIKENPISDVLVMPVWEERENNSSWRTMPPRTIHDMSQQTDSSWRTMPAFAQQQNDSIWRTIPAVPGFQQNNNSWRTMSAVPGFQEQNDSSWNTIPAVPGFQQQNDSSWRTMPAVSQQNNSWRTIPQYENRAESSWNTIPAVPGFSGASTNNWATLPPVQNQFHSIPFIDRTNQNSFGQPPVCSTPMYNQTSFGFDQPLMSSTPMGQQNYQDQTFTDDSTLMQTVLEQTFPRLFHSGQNIKYSGNFQPKAPPLPQKIAPQMLERKCENCPHFQQFDSSSNLENITAVKSVPLAQRISSTQIKNCKACSTEGKSCKTTQCHSKQQETNLSCQDMVTPLARSYQVQKFVEPQQKPSTPLSKTSCLSCKCSQKTVVSRGTLCDPNCTGVPHPTPSFKGMTQNCDLNPRFAQPFVGKNCDPNCPPFAQSFGGRNCDPNCPPQIGQPPFDLQYLSHQDFQSPSFNPSQYIRQYPIPDNFYTPRNYFQPPPNGVTGELYRSAYFAESSGSNCSSPPTKRNKGIQKTGSLYKLKRRKCSKKCAKQPSDDISSDSTLSSHKKSQEYIRPTCAATQPEISNRKCQ